MKRALDLLTLAVVCALSLLLSLAPHGPNARRGAAAGMTYLGFSMNAPDQAVYLSWIEQARQGHWVLGNLFDAHPAPAKLPNLTFLAIGKCAALCGVDTPTAYVAARAFALILLALAAMALAWSLAGEVLPRRLALAWIMLGTGWGAYFWALHARADPDLYEWLVVQPWCPADVAIPEFTPAVAGANYAHMILGTALMALAMAALAAGRARGSIAWGLLAGGIALLDGYAHVYDVLVLLGVVSVLAARAWWCGDRTRAAVCAAFLVPAAVPFVHYVAIFATDAYLKQWSKVPLPSPSPTAYAAGLGSAFVLAVAGLWRMRREAVTRDDELVAVWIAVQCVLVYTGPLIFFERRLCEGMWLPFVVLGAGEVARRLAGRALATRALVLALLAASVAPTGLVVAWLTSQRQPQHRWYFRSPQELAVITGLSKMTGPDDVILSEPSLSLLIPGYAGRKVAVGHVDHTRNYTALARAALRFLDGRMPPAEARAFLAETGSTFYLAPAMNEVPVPLGPDVLEPVARAGNFGLFRVKPESGTAR